jgi:hypothetical protein
MAGRTLFMSWPTAREHQPDSHQHLGAWRRLPTMQPTSDDGAGYRTDHLERCRGGDRQWHRLQAGTRLRCLARARSEAGVDRGSHDPGQDLQTRQQVPENAFVQAAHVILARRPSAAMRGLWPWIEQASKRLHRNLLAIALANKLARIAWAVLAHGREYQPRIMPQAV